MTSDYEKGKMEYLRTKVLTASPEELHLMLYDGAIRFAEEGKAALLEGNIEKAHNALVRAQNIVLEMSSGLDHSVDPDLCAKMSSLYNFIYRRFIEANLRRETSHIDDTLKILNFQRETWVLLIEKLAEERKGGLVAASVAPANSENDGQEKSFAEPGLSLSLSA
jgi:flagellar secretion chaperone FliS